MDKLSMTALLFIPILATMACQRDQWEARFEDYGASIYWSSGSREESELGSAMLLGTELIERHDAESVTLMLFLASKPKSQHQVYQEAFFRANSAASGTGPPLRKLSDKFRAAFEEIYYKFPQDSNWSDDAFRFAEKTLQRSDSSLDERASSLKLIIGAGSKDKETAEKGMKLIESASTKSDLSERERRFWHDVIPLARIILKSGERQERG